jgi:hypothetical protein
VFRDVPGGRRWFWNAWWGALTARVTGTMAKHSTFALLHPRHARLVRGAAHERSVGGVRRFRFVFVTGYKLLMVAQVPKDISGLIGS